MHKLSQSTRGNEFSFRLTSHGLVAVMLTCAVFTLLSLIERILPGQQPLYLPVLCLFCALERLYTYRRFQKLILFSREWAITVLSEWVVIALLVKLVTGLSHGVGAFVREIGNWLKDFSYYFLTIEFVLTLVVVLGIWIISGLFASLLNEMDLAQAIRFEADPGQEKDTIPARERLMALIFSLGTVLVVLTALVRLDLRGFLAHTGNITFADMPALAGGGASTLLYFMLGMALLSQTRFIDLHTRWSVQHIPVNHKLGRDWALYSLGFLGLMVALVALLPTSYSLETLSFIGTGLNFIINLLFFIAQGILGVVILLISLLMMLFGKRPDEIKNQGVTPKLQPPVTAGDLASTPAWLEAAKTTIFWIIFLAILIFSLVQYLRQHGEVLAALRKVSDRARLTRIWRWLRSQFRKARTSIAHTIQTARERLQRAGLGAGSQPGSRFFSPRNLDTRQKIIFFYLAFIRRGGEKGLPRRPSQTPYEYASVLDTALPEVEEDIDTLTNAFIEARYSPRPVEPEQVNSVKNTWERLRKALRPVKR